MRERGNSLLRGLDAWAGIPLTVPAYAYRRLSRPGAGQGIGIICLGAIGDLLLATGLISSLRARFPDTDLELIASSANAPALPLVGGLTSHYAASIARPDKILTHLRQKKFAYLFDLSQWARIGSLLCAVSKATLTIGFATPGQYRGLPYDVRAFHDAARHEADNFLALAQMLWPDCQARPSLALPDWRPEEDAPVYCHMWPAPGRGRELKQWPERHWTELIQLLLRWGKRVVLTGSSADQSETEAFIRQYFPHSDKIVSVAGKLHLLELGRHFTRSAAVVSVNTGVMHLAALSGAPTVGLHGATNPRRWGPVGPRTRALMPCAGAHGYLNLGFEYPARAKPAMGYLWPSQVEEALGELGVTGQ